MTGTLPLDRADRERLQRKAGAARTALRLCAVLGLIAPVTIVVFVSFTPTQWSLGSGALVGLLVLVMAGPFWVKCLDLVRTIRRVARWLAQGEKRQHVGEVTGKGPNMVRVGEMAVVAWEKARTLSVGDEVTVEYLPLDGHLDGIVGVLSIDGEPNPYFESPWRSGPPTA